MGRRLAGGGGQEMFKKKYFASIVMLPDTISIYIKLSINACIAADKHANTLYYTSGIAHRDKDGDYQIYSRAKDSIRYRGELLNLPIIEGAAVSVIDKGLS